VAIAPFILMTWLIHAAIAAVLSAPIVFFQPEADSLALA
jgi:hypothetical protein